MNETSWEVLLEFLNLGGLYNCGLFGNLKFNIIAQSRQGLDSNCILMEA